MKTIISIAIVAILATTTLFSCSNNTKSATEQAEILQYQCPMKCEGEKTYDKEGVCPICNMNLKEHKH